MRKYSYNRGLLWAFAQELPANVKFTLADISEIPFFNADHEQPYPAPVVKLKKLLNTADALVISSPEQSHLRDVMFALNMKVLSRPIIQIATGSEKFDQEGNLTDSRTKELLVQLKDALITALS